MADAYFAGLFICEAERAMHTKRFTCCLLGQSDQQNIVHIDYACAFVCFSIPSSRAAALVIKQYGIFAECTNL